MTRPQESRRASATAPRGRRASRSRRATSADALRRRAPGLRSWTRYLQRAPFRRSPRVSRRTFSRLDPPIRPPYSVPTADRTKGENMSEKTTEVQAYEKPAVVDHGDLRELTEAGTKKRPPRRDVPTVAHDDVHLQRRLGRSRSWNKRSPARMRRAFPLVTARAASRIRRDPPGGVPTRLPLPRRGQRTRARPGRR